MGLFGRAHALATVHAGSPRPAPAGAGCCSWPARPASARRPWPGSCCATRPAPACGSRGPPAGRTPARPRTGHGSRRCAASSHRLPPNGRDAARFRLFDESRLPGRAGGRHPVVVVLDDLHWSDEPSLLALSFVAGQVRTARVLLLGTYREDEAGPRLLDLARSAPVVQLAGLAEPDVARLMAELAGAAPEPAVAATCGGAPAATRSSPGR